MAGVYVSPPASLDRTSERVLPNVMEVRVIQRLARTLLLALLPLSFIAACTEGRVPTAVVSGPAQAKVASQTTTGVYDPSAGAMDLSAVAQLTLPRGDTIGFVKAWIGPAGGRVEFLKRYAIEVPPGAVDKVTAFTIRVYMSQPAKEYAVAEFLPHGTFNVPVYVEVPYYGTTAYGGSTQVLWWDDRADAWIGMGGGITADGMRVRTATPHFTPYATQQTASTSAGTTIQAGAGA
jgi:hypothetical protein